MQQPRFFNDKQRDALFLDADGVCAECGVLLTAVWHADHIIPFVAGGVTDVRNGQALCPECNLRKGARLENDAGLREWQIDALESYRLRMGQQRDFLVVACPGAGKTKMSLRLMADLLEEGVVQQVIVVVPTDGLRTQWRDVAAETVGVELAAEAVSREGHLVAGYRGWVTTYAAACKNPYIFQRRIARASTLVIFDEIHHAGEQTRWGVELVTAFGDATRRLSLSGTPFRGDRQSIPFVRYDERDKAIADAQYSYVQAINDGVCRQVEFKTYEGDIAWLDIRTNREWSATFADQVPERVRSARLRTALDLRNEWLPGVFEDADRTLREMRVNNDGDLAGLVLAINRKHAFDIEKMLTRVTGQKPTVIVSDAPDGPDGLLEDDDWSSLDGKRREQAQRDNEALLKEFRNGRDGDPTGDRYRGVPRWIVAVRMVSEGVDIPRLGVLVYATNVVTELFFRQAIGRVVRVKEGTEGMSARVYLPADDRLVGMAREVMEEVDLGLAQVMVDALGDTADKNPSSGSGEQQSLYQPLSATPTAHDIVVGGEAFSQNDVALVERFRVAARGEAGVNRLSDGAILLLMRSAQQMSGGPAPSSGATEPDAVASPSRSVPLDKRRDTLRKQRKQLVENLGRRNRATLDFETVNRVLKRRFNGAPNDQGEDALVVQIALLKEAILTGVATEADWDRLVARGH